MGQILSRLTTNEKMVKALDSLPRYHSDGTHTIITPNPETGEETTTVLLHHRYIYRGYLQIATCDLTRAAHPCLWLITWDPTQPIATRPLAIQKDSTWYCYGWDLPKNICEIYSTTGYIRTVYTYTPYGEVTASGNVTQSPRGLGGGLDKPKGFAPQGRGRNGVRPSQPIQWSSEYTDTELGLIYYNYRYYNPTDGRWTRRDPYNEFFNCNLYRMCNNAPSHLCDFLGLAWTDTHGVQKCKADDTCVILSAKASQWITAFSIRYIELTEDKYNLKKIDPVKYNNHIDQIKNARDQAKKCLTILTKK